MVDLGAGPEGGVLKKRVQLRVTGMSCASCVAKIERHLSKRPGEPAAALVWGISSVKARQDACSSL